MDAVLIDVREYAEFAAGHIEGSRLVPLGSLKDASRGWSREEALLLVCKSGVRSEKARQMLEAEGFTSLRVLEQGIDGWRAAGNPLVVAERRPWSLERQVRTAAGSLVLVTMLLGWAVSPWFLLGTAGVGAGLVFAGVSDTCMMGSVLSRMPWNRPSAGAARTAA